MVTNSKKNEGGIGMTEKERMFGQKRFLEGYFFGVFWGAALVVFAYLFYGVMVA